MLFSSKGKTREIEVYLLRTVKKNFFFFFSNYLREAVRNIDMVSVERFYTRREALSLKYDQALSPCDR
jgi:hypothetical protein